MCVFFIVFCGFALLHTLGPFTSSRNVTGTCGQWGGLVGLGRILDAAETHGAVAIIGGIHQSEHVVRAKGGGGWVTDVVLGVPI